MGDFLEFFDLKSESKLNALFKQDWPKKWMKLNGRASLFFISSFKQTSMKKLLTLCILMMITKMGAQCPWSFTVTSNNGTHNLNCIPASVDFTVSTDNLNLVYLLWTGPAFSSNNAYVTVTQPGTYTLVLTDQVTFCAVTQTINVGTAAPISFTINNNSPSYSITCASPSINLDVNANCLSPNHLWTGPGFTLNSSSVSIGAIGNYSVQVTNPLTVCSNTQTFSIGINTIAPTNFVNPLSQTVACSGGSPFTFSGTATSPSINILNEWIHPALVPLSSTGNTLSILSGVFAPGVYTFVTTNTINGCADSKTVTVISPDAWPSFYMNSSTNYSIGCAPLNQTTISIVNAVSTQTPPATTSYTLLPPSFVGVVTPSVILGNTTFANFGASQVGTWTVIVQDDNNFCRNSVPVLVTQYTVAPSIFASMITRTLSCVNPTIFASGSSTTANTQINWNQIIYPPLVATSTIIIGPGSGPPISPTITAYGTYTVVVTNTVSACVSTSLIPIYTGTMLPSFTYSNFGAGLVWFASTSTGTNGGTIFTWDFGDGSTGTGLSTSHTYTNGGIHNVILSTSNLSCNSNTLPVNVNSIPCLANSGFTLAYSGTPQTWNASPNYYGNVINAVWNWGDGSSDNLMFTSHTYSAAGLYNICLSVTVSCANSSSTCSGYNIYKASGSVNTDQLMVTVNVLPKLAVGLKSIAEDQNQFILYPNPTNSSFYVKNTQQKSGTIKVFNLEGKEIENIILTGASTGSASTSASTSSATNSATTETKIENLKAGIYFVEIKIEGTVHRKKIVVLE